MNSIVLPNNVVLMPIPVSPNPDYMAGSDGNIYSRTRYKGFGKRVYVDWYALTGCISSKGYLIVSLCHENKKVTKSVHRLICMAFHGMPEMASLQVRHLDGTRQNNKPDNLCWGTQQENWQDRKSHGRGMEGEKHHASKLSDAEREHLRWSIAKGLCSQRHAARILGMSQSSIGVIANTNQE